MEMAHRMGQGPAATDGRPAPVSKMKRNSTKITAQSLSAGLFFLYLCCVLPANAQTPKSGQDGKGTRQRVANPLNDLLEEARQDIEKQDFQAAIAPLQKFLAAKDDFAYAHFQLGYAYTGLQKRTEARGERSSTGPSTASTGGTRAPDAADERR